MKIGLVDIMGAVPGFETFGNLPTDLVNSKGLVSDESANKVLDGIIIPGGSIIESQSMTPELSKEIKLMASDGKFVLGICSGFQALSNKVDIGRNSPTPIEKKGLELLDVSFSPLINTNRIEADVINTNSFLTKNLENVKVKGFHCHTYGKITGDADPIFESKINMVDYVHENRSIIDGVKNKEGNVVGTMIHACLDNNPLLVNNIFDFIDANENQRIDITNRSKELSKKIHNSFGINLEIKNTTDTFYKKEKNSLPYMLMLGSTGSDDGKTFISTGIVGALRHKGYKVAVLKVGPDVRDVVPSLYLTRDLMEDYSSIKIGHLGWMDLKEIFLSLKDSQYDFVIIEGVMGIFTGLLNEIIPYSGAEIAMAGNIPLILVSGCSKGGIETSVLELNAHLELLEKLGVNVPAVILNRVYNNEIFEESLHLFKNKENLKMIAQLPKVKLDKRGGTPEVEINFDSFCKTALNTIENNLDIEKLIKLSRKPVFKDYTSFNDIKKLIR